MLKKKVVRTTDMLELLHKAQIAICFLLVGTGIADIWLSQKWVLAGLASGVVLAVFSGIPLGLILWLSEDEQEEVQTPAVEEVSEG